MLTVHLRCLFYNNNNNNYSKKKFKALKLNLFKLYSTQKKQSIITVIDMYLNYILCLGINEANMEIEI